MAWTDEKKAFAFKVQRENRLSASETAAEINRRWPGSNVSRNAVIGIFFRAKVAFESNYGKPKKARRIPGNAAGRTRKPKVARASAGSHKIGQSAILDQIRAKPEAYVEPKEELVIPLAERKSIQQIEESDCRWPIGDPRKPDFHFCAKSKVPGLPYCEHHARRAFQAVTPRSSRSKAAIQVVKQKENA